MEERDNKERNTADEFLRDHLALRTNQGDAEFSWRVLSAMHTPAGIRYEYEIQFPDISASLHLDYVREDHPRGLFEDHDHHEEGWNLSAKFEGEWSSRSLSRLWSVRELRQAAIVAVGEAKETRDRKGAAERKRASQWDSRLSAFADDLMDRGVRFFEIKPLTRLLNCVSNLGFGARLVLGTFRRLGWLATQVLILLGMYRLLVREGPLVLSYLKSSFPPLAQALVPHLGPWLSAILVGIVGCIGAGAVIGVAKVIFRVGNLPWRIVEQSFRSEQNVPDR